MTRKIQSLSEKLLAYMSRKPHRRYVPNDFTKLFKVSTRAAADALETLLESGKLVSEPLPPKSCVYFINPKGLSPDKLATPTQRYTPVWRELNGWEAEMRNHRALCELARPK